MAERLEATHNSMRFVVERDDNVGWYLYVYQGGQCTRDYLQDTLEAALDEALQLFGVPQSGWSPLPD